ncbi:MAG: Bax inhibitor-1/YccA family protein [Deltaproteobacteria bacterium]|jgi:FtsH-binding integral membrane protein|nr:Bax inhibitor-1/YccA family protein [Deltaproteobacteria bacterium]
MNDFTNPPRPSAQPNTNQGQSLPAVVTESGEALFFQKIYFWMCGGLVLTAFLAMGLARSSSWISFLRTSPTFSIILIIGLQLGLCTLINLMLNKLSSAVIKGLFILFAASISLTISLVLLIYPSDVVFKAFISTAIVYGAMATYGLVTKRSLQAWGSFLFMGLVGLIITMLVNFFLKSPMMDFIISAFGVLIFAGLTAYDNQKLRVIYAGGFEDDSAQEKMVVFGAMTLYLDFINLFLFLLRLFGDRR